MLPTAALLSLARHKVSGLPSAHTRNGTPYRLPAALQLFTWKLQTLTCEQYKHSTMQTISPAKVYRHMHS